MERELILPPSLASFSRVAGRRTCLQRDRQNKDGNDFHVRFLVCDSDSDSAPHYNPDRPVFQNVPLFARTLILVTLNHGVLAQPFGRNQKITWSSEPAGAGLLPGRRVSPHCAKSC
jgi:hypothetical protein